MAEKPSSICIYGISGGADRWLKIPVPGDPAARYRTYRPHEGVRGLALSQDSLLGLLGRACRTERPDPMLVTPLGSRELGWR
jgi:hypothetical protein